MWKNLGILFWGLDTLYFKIEQFGLVLNILVGILG